MICREPTLSLSSRTQLPPPPYLWLFADTLAPCNGSPGTLFFDGIEDKPQVPEHTHHLYVLHQVLDCHEIGGGAQCDFSRGRRFVIQASLLGTADSLGVVRFPQYTAPDTARKFGDYVYSSLIPSLRLGHICLFRDGDGDPWWTNTLLWNPPGGGIALQECTPWEARDVVSGQSLGEIPNSLPIADFTYYCDELTCQFQDLSNDVDPDSYLSSWSWNFGDSTTSTQRNPSHTYGGSGSYTVRLTVTDDQGAHPLHDATADLNPYADIGPPIAAFSFRCGDLTGGLNCFFTDSSADAAGGAVDSLHWEFGDGGTSTQAEPAHPYPEDGTYSVVLQVWDGSSSAVTSAMVMPFTATIDGTNIVEGYQHIASDQQCTWTGNPSLPVGAYSYRWNRGIQLVSTDRTYSGDVTSTWFYLTLTVTRIGRNESAVGRVKVYPDSATICD